MGEPLRDASSWFEHPVTAWRYASARIGEPGPALSPALLEEEARYGATRDVVWSYADALPLLLGDAIRSDVTPLGFARGRLTAAAVEDPVFIAGLEYVQTTSPEVCRIYAGSVPWFKVMGRSCVEALASVRGVVRRVDVRLMEPFEIDADFEIRLPRGPEPAPRWFQRLPTSAFLIPVAQLDDDVWLCWDRDHRCARIAHHGGQFYDGRTGPRDVLPEVTSPPWAGREQVSFGGNGWASTTARVGERSASSFDAQDRRWLSLSSFNCDIDALHAAWRDRRALRPLVGETGSHATFSSLELGDGTAQIEWIGVHRVLRVRGGRLEQLTVDHDLRSLAAQQGLELPPEALDNMLNIVTKSLPQADPDRATCDVQPGDRFVLLHASTQRLLEEEATGELAAWLGRGSVRQVARWIRSVLLRADERDAAVVIDADAVVARGSATSRAEPSPLEVTVNALVYEPQKYYRKQIRCRGVFHSYFEGMRFADAWFRCEPPLPSGAWLVDVEGMWLHDGTSRGHMGQYASELIGSAQLVSIADPRIVRESEMPEGRRYTPLRSEVTLQQRLQGWTWRDDRWLHRLGPDTRLPEPAFPMEARATITWMVDGYRQLGLFSWTVHETRPLVPQPAEVTDEIPRGRLVEVQGVLRWPGGPPPEPRSPRTQRHAEILKRAAYVSITEGYSNWPALDGVLSVVLPSCVRTPQRYALPPQHLIDDARAKLGPTKLVTIIGEMADSVLFALSVETNDGPIDL